MQPGIVGGDGLDFFEMFQRFGRLTLVFEIKSFGVQGLGLFLGRRSLLCQCLFALEGGRSRE